MATADSRMAGFDCPHCRRKPEYEGKHSGGEGSILPCRINGDYTIDDGDHTNRQQSASMQQNGVASKHPIITDSPNADHHPHCNINIMPASIDTEGIPSPDARSLHRHTIKEVAQQARTHIAGCQRDLPHSASFEGLSIQPSSCDDDGDHLRYHQHQTIENCMNCRSAGQGNSILENDVADVEKSDLIVCFGEMLIDFVPTVGGYSLAEAPSFKKAPGGAPANVAVAIARLGGHSAFIGKVGDDEFGHMLKGILMHYGVDSTGLRFDANARTALAFVTLRDDGEREFMFYRNPSADMLLQENELDLGLISRASIFHYGSISLISEPCRSAHIAAMRAAKSSGALLSYDPNVRLPLWPSAEEARKGIMSIWTEADLIKVSDEEIAFLTDGQDPTDDDVVMQLWHPGLKLFLITEGQEGCRYYTKEFHGRVPGFKVSAIDTTGAGDAFVGGILSQLVSDKSLYEDDARLREALRFANACGALTTTERGAIPALPDKDSALRLTTRLERSQSLTRVPSWQNISQWRVPSRQQSREILEEDVTVDHHK